MYFANLFIIFTIFLPIIIINLQNYPIIYPFTIITAFLLEINHLLIASSLKLKNESLKFKNYFYS